jgi:hypothetical protein
VAACETSDRSFIVHVWLEEPVTERRAAGWRGHITPVTFDGKRRPIYIADLLDIELVIGASLGEMGARMGWVWRWHAWRRRDRLRLQEER